MIRWDDSLLAHHAYASHLPHKLDQLVSENCDTSPWKIQHGRRGGDEQKGSLAQASEDDLCRYNALDCRLTALSWQRLQRNLEPERATYELDLQLSRICRRMTARGIGVDEAARATLSGELESRAESLAESLRAQLEWPQFAPSKLGDVREALFTRLGAPVTLRSAKTGIPATSDAALESLQGVATPAGVFATKLLTWRKVTKIRATYVDSIRLWRDGRAHPDWKAFGTVSGRLAGRLQSCPRYKPRHPEDRVRALYVPAPGNEFVYFDVSQAEMRLAAYLSNDPAFIKACEGDVHANNAAAVFPDIAAKGWLTGKLAKSPEHGGPFRDIAKNLGFAISYGAEADKVFTTLRRKGFQVSYGAVQVILSRLRSKYRVYYAWAESNVDLCRRQGYLRGLRGRIRYFGRYPKPTEIFNYPIQEALAAVMNERVVALDEPTLVAQIHDACIFDVPKGAPADALERRIREQWAEPISTLGGPLVLPIDLKRGMSWAAL